MTNNRILLVGDGGVALELAEALKGAGVDVESYLHPGPIDLANERPFTFLCDEFDRLDWLRIDLVLLAMTSPKEVQKRILREIEARAGEETTFLVSAMSCAATETASWLRLPERVVGFGVVAPVSEARAIEVCLPLQVKGCTRRLDEVVHMLGGLHHKWVTVRDSAGLVMPRLVAAVVNEAFYALMEGAAEAEDIDTAMKLGTSYPYGPLEWADRIGLDQIHATLCGVQEEQGGERYRPAPLLRRLVLAGQFGEASGRGVYEHGEENADA